MSSPTDDANAVWNAKISRRDPDGTVWQNPALQELCDIKTLLLSNGINTLHGETTGIVSAILDALPGIVDSAVKDALASNILKVEVSVNGTPQVTTS